MKTWWAQMLWEIWCGYNVGYLVGWWKIRLKNKIWSNVHIFILFYRQWETIKVLKVRNGIIRWSQLLSSQFKPPILFSLLLFVIPFFSPTKLTPMPEIFRWPPFEFNMTHNFFIPIYTGSYIIWLLPASPEFF